MQVVCSNTVAQKRLTESNGTPAMDLGHMNVVFKFCICMVVAVMELQMRYCKYHYYSVGKTNVTVL